MLVESLPSPSAAPRLRQAPPSAFDPWAPIAGRILLPFLASWRGNRYRQHLRGAEALLAGNAEDLAQRTLSRLGRMLRHAFETVPFYRDRMSEHDFDPYALRRLEDLRRLPPLTRADVGANVGRLISGRYRSRPLLQVHTGGTTTRPLPFVQRHEAGWRKDAIAEVLRGRIGWDTGHRVALLWGAMQDAPSGPGGRLRRWKDNLLHRWVERQLWLPADQLDTERLEGYARRLARFRPHVMQAYPSAADLLARHLLGQGRRLHIPLVLLTAETVFPAQRKRIAEALGAEVSSFYGAREIGWIASECRDVGAMHVNTAGVHLETTEKGRLLVTDLVDPATPLLRYEIGDSGRLANEPCPCGDPRPVISELHGRVLDVFQMPSGRRVPGVLCDVRNYQLADGIVETQLVQERPEAIEVRWVAGPHYVPENLTTLREWLDEQFRGEVRLDLRQVDAIEAEPNGKFRYCICRLPPDPD